MSWNNVWADWPSYCSENNLTHFRGSELTLWLGTHFLKLFGVNFSKLCAFHTFSHQHLNTITNTNTNFLALILSILDTRICISLIANDEVQPPTFEIFLTWCFRFIFGVNWGTSTRQFCHSWHQTFDLRFCMFPFHHYSESGFNCSEMRKIIYW